ncbi:Fic family protein [Neolewinella lacunae]|uniref:Fic family protein n=1 Tax=Neolewinella lacunae TaxID=1517758 RepID=A0A923T9S8_9BACT|nr:Fic family protein [Neolewinella lacunae]MBC6995383.1 Fic family protein [Neolewinella lacunae]MDN3633095.1 Fic family protein [Neolewinella lacunae]
MSDFIQQRTDWPTFIWESDAVINLLGEARNLQGRLVGKMESLGFDLRNEAVLNTLTLDVIKTSEIEGEYLNPDQVRSSIARRLGIAIEGAADSDRNVDGVVEMMLDATQHCFEPLTPERLFDWHAALFPTGRSGMYKIRVAHWREDTTGPMQVVSGAMGKERVHFQAPDSARVEKEMNLFLDWFNNDPSLDLVLKAAISHFWFVTIHPFEDGNGRIARAITDMVLAQSDKSKQRFYSMSAQIRIERKGYYEVLEKTQKGDLNITAWMQWFLSCLISAIKSTDSLLVSVLFKADFWSRHAKTLINERQHKLLNKLLDGIDRKMTSSKWAKMAKCSKDTAIRDINDLIEKNILQKEAAGGRSTNYELKT